MSPAPAVKNYHAAKERRTQRRFEVSAPVEYVLPDCRGQGVTCDMSSHGILIRTGSTLPVGELVKLYIDWPALLDGSHRLRLAVTGTVLRSSVRGTAVRILRHEYKLRPKGVERLAKVG